MYRSERSAISTLQAVVVIALIVIVAGGGFWWYSSTLHKEPHPAGPPSGELPTSYQRYSRFGFSFEYPEGMVFTAGRLLGGFDHAHPLHGDVQGFLEAVPEAMGVIWAHFEEEPPFEALLDHMFMSVEESGDLQDLERGELTTSTINDREVLSQAFEFKEDGIDSTGSMAIWYEEEDKRIYVVYSIAASAAQLDVQSNVERYVESFESEGYEAPSGEIEAYWPTKGWRVARAEDVGVDYEVLEGMVEHINAEGIGADSVMVIKDGYVVMDAYFPGFDEGELHIVYSCTKSVVSTLIGLAMEEGRIGSLDLGLADLFPSRTMGNPSAWKDEMTLRDLLTMTAGFDAEDSYLYDWVGLERMHDAPDALQYVLDLPVIEEPSTRFEYTNGVSHLLSCLITEATGVSALDYARERLFSPLGIGEAEWRTDSLGRNWGYSSLYLTPHDMAKIGYLFLNGGEWDGEQVVPREWVEEATRKHFHAGTLLDDYGFQWWVSPKGYYSAIGYKGQFIHIVPDLDLVMVTTSSRAEDFDRIQDLLEAFVIPACQG
jgi:CubicO group peptidase (beta-lactamase class C family)